MVPNLVNLLVYLFANLFEKTIIIMNHNSGS